MQTANRHLNPSFYAERHTSRRPRAGICFFAAALGMLVILSNSGCITAPPKKRTAVEMAREETAVGGELENQFDSKMKFRLDPVVENYLNTVAKALSRPSGDPRLTDSQVVVIQDQAKLWRTYSLPGMKIYVSLGLLRQLHFDNEVASVIALEYGNLLQSHALNHLKKQIPAQTPGAAPGPPKTPARVDFFSPEGLFSFDVEEVKASIKSAVEILYRGGFDIRGVIQVWKILEHNPGHSPFPDSVLQELLQYTRSVISHYAPLRNPIVQTEEFPSVYKRIMKL